MVEFDEASDKVTISQYNCLLGKVASDYPEVCKHELVLFKELLGKKVERHQCQRDGANACVYTIPIEL